MSNPPGLVRWAEASLRDSMKVTKGHIDKPDKFIMTMATCSPFGAIIVHGTEGNVTILHHGTLYSHGIGMKPVVVFVSRHRISSPFKILDIEETVLPVGSGSLGTRAHPIDNPSLVQSFLKAKSADDFHGLKATKDKENKFKDHRNHFMIGNDILQLVVGKGTAPAKDLTWTILQNASTRKIMMMTTAMMMMKTMMMTTTRSQFSTTSGSSATTSVEPPKFSTSMMTTTVLTNTVSESVRSWQTLSPPPPCTVAGDVNIGFDPTFIATQTALN